MHLFRARLRRVGNSLGVIVPKDVVDDAGAREGQEIEFAIVPSPKRRRRLLEGLIGSAPRLEAFERERGDRF